LFEPPTAAKAEIERKEREDGEEPFLGRGGGARSFLYEMKLTTEGARVYKDIHGRFPILHGLV